MNDAFIAMQHRDELQDTLFFAGLDNQYRKDTVRGKKAYVFKTDKLNLTIIGRNIIIDDIKVSVREAKKILCERTI
jgi:hypothetical protein